VTAELFVYYSRTNYKPAKQAKLSPSRVAPLGGADLRFSSPQPDTSLYSETTDTGIVHRAACLRLPTEGRPGWVDLGGWLYTEIVNPPADGYPSWH